MKSPIRVAQLSFSFLHAEEFCRCAGEAWDVELVGIWDSDHERGRQAAGRHWVPFYKDLNELLGQENLDAVSLCAEPLCNPCWRKQRGGGCSAAEISREAPSLWGQLNTDPSGARRFHDTRTISRRPTRSPGDVRSINCSAARSPARWTADLVGGRWSWSARRSRFASVSKQEEIQHDH